MSRILLLGITLMALTLIAMDTRQALAQQPQGNGTVTGIITDPNDKPMASFAVKFYQFEARGIDSGRRRNAIDQSPDPSELAEKLVLTVTTDATGKFTASNVKAGGYLLKGGSKAVGFLYHEVTVEPGKTTDMGRVKLVKT